MDQYNKIEDAIAALLQKYGNEVLDNTSRFIALLSDYAPDFMPEQQVIRKFARSGGFNLITKEIASQASAESVFGSICYKAVQAGNKQEECQKMVDIIKNLPGLLNTRYSSSLNPRLVYEEGMNYFRRFPKDANIPVSVLIFEEAGELGCSDALFYLSGIYLKGKWMPRDTNKGIRFLELASEKNNTRASLQLAEFLWKGINIEKNLSRSISLLEKTNDANASYMLGEIHRENRDYQKALNYYLSAAEKNHVYAQYSAALAYATGQGTKRNIQEAKKWLRESARLGHTEARKKLEDLGERWD